MTIDCLLIISGSRMSMVLSIQAEQIYCPRCVRYVCLLMSMKLAYCFHSIWFVVSAKLTYAHIHSIATKYYWAPMHCQLRTKLIAYDDSIGKIIDFHHHWWEHELSIVYCYLQCGKPRARAVQCSQTAREIRLLYAPVSLGL